MMFNKIVQLALLGLVVVCLVLSVQAKTTQAPQLCDLVCPKPLPDEPVYLAADRCEDYCQCDPRGAILQHCPIWNNETGEQLYFNVEKQVCDWPEDSGCVNE